MYKRQEYYKLLIGWRIVGNGDTMLFEDAADAGSRSDGMARYLEIELIRKQCVKLDAEHSALGKQDVYKRQLYISASSDGTRQELGC